MSVAVFLYAFFLVSLIHIGGEFSSDPWRSRIRHYSKPILMPLLIAYALIGSDTPNALIIIGLILGWIGDVVLMFPKIAAFFLLGLASFLIGHALYIYAFLEAAFFLRDFPIWFWALMLAFLLLALLFYMYFKPYLIGEHADKKVPVMLYALIIAGMSYSSLAIPLAIPDARGVYFIWMAFAGSVLFMVSDFMLARQLFVKPIKYDQAGIMLSYLAAQYLIAQSFTPTIW